MMDIRLLKANDIVEYIGPDTGKLQYGTPFVILGFVGDDEAALLKTDYNEIDNFPEIIWYRLDALQQDLSCTHNQLGKYFSYHGHLAGDEDGLVEKEATK